MSSTSRTLKRLGVATVGVSTLVATPILGMATAYAAAPTITITSQSTNSASTNNDGTDTTVKISANVVAATAPNAAVASVRFSYTPLAGTPTVIGTDTTAPYSINWTPPAGGGTFTLTADAFDSANTTPASATATKAGVVVTNNASSVHFLTPAEGGQIGVFNGKIAVSGSRSADFPALSVTSQTRDNTTGVLSAAGAATVVPATTGGASWSAVVASPTCAAVAPATCDSVITVATTGGVNGNSDEVTQATQYAQTLTTAPQFVVTPASANKPNNGTQDYVATLTDQNGKPVGGVKTTAGTSGPGTIVTSPTSTDGKGTATYTGTAGATAATTTYTFQTAIGGGAFVAGTDFSRTATLTSYAPVATSATLTATPAKSLYAAQTEYPPVVEFCTVDQNGNGITATGPQVVAATRTRTDSTTVGTPTAVPAVTTPETGAKANCYLITVPAPSGTFGQDVVFAYVEVNGTPGFQTGDISAPALTLKYANLAITGLNTQAQKGTATAVSFKVLGADRSPFVGRKITLSTPTSANSGFTATQPAGTTAPVAGAVVATTDASGVATATVNNLPTTPPMAGPVSIVVNAKDDITTVNAPGQVPTSAATDTSATVEFRDLSVALKTITTSGAATLIAPAGSPNGTGSPRPGDVLEQTYTLTDANSGSNILRNTPVTLTLDHGFFTGPCPATPNTERYANCSFTTAPAAGGVVGVLKPSTASFVTDNSGTVTVDVALGRDAAIDVSGSLPALLTAVANGGTAKPAAAVTTFSTNGIAPINGGTVKLVPAVATQTLSGDKQQPAAVSFAVQVTDQFGNLVKLPAASPVTLAVTPAAPASSVTPTSVGNYTGDTSGFASVSSATTSFSGVATTVTATFAAPVTTFTNTTVAPAAPNFATTPPGTAVNKTDSFTVNFYAVDKANLAFTFGSTPSNTVPINTAVTTSVTVKDQKGNPVAGLSVQFIRSGPSDAAGNSQTAGSTSGLTGADGRRGTSYSSGAPGVATVTVIVTDGNGNEISRGVQNVTFTKGTPAAGPLSITTTNGGPLAGQKSYLTVHGTPGASYSVRAANRPSSVFLLNHQGVLNGSGVSTYEIHPINNVNFIADSNGVSSPQIVISVHTSLNIFAKRSGNVITFFGNIYPSNRNQAIFIKTGSSTVGQVVRNGRSWTLTVNLSRFKGRTIPFYSYTLSDTQNANGHSRFLSIKI